MTCRAGSTGPGGCGGGETTAMRSGTHNRAQCNRPLRRCITPCRSLSLTKCQEGLPLGSKDSAPLPAQAALPGPLLPELAQLRWLEHLIFEGRMQTMYAGIPSERGQPGAFPRLQRWVRDVGRELAVAGGA